MVEIMKTKEQKNKIVDETKKLLDNSQNLFFVDFTGTGVEEMKNLRRTLKTFGAKMKVIKKKLLRVALEKNKTDFNPERFEEQLATIFSGTDVFSIASPIYKFFKSNESKGFKILGAYDLIDKKFMDENFIKQIGQLPSREILLAQLVGMLSAPMRMFLYVLSEKSKQTVENK